ncbi:Por secretion system C-terminal sorting domain-containing protein [Hymenobacter daecheongensis DSM 21074]|uniref:Por secretion system C-terminal sorting domain-containing protein n=1 Tax=Hymenobacter daecheongensis DSM 21074 TaxID=1121955 RepID=A0A1M6FD86_9BACT|nr:S8 family peptidase [Hymenobacter daecheongensis]SHI95589.1 Por secretion system C-terminal sorting domain-containing protein [Hymenobacter daecheongensis DSM 21074]
MNLLLRYFFLLGLLLGPAATFAQQLAPVSPVLPGTLVFRLKPEFHAQASTDYIAVPALTAALQSIGATQLRQKFPRAVPASTEIPGSVELRLVYQLELAPEASLEKACRALLQTGTVAYAEPLRYRAPLYQPNDPLADSTNASGQFYLKNIQAYRAWDVTKGDTSIVIGITDTGTRYTHEDLAGQVKKNYADPIDGLDNDGDGYVDNFRGWDVADNDNDASTNPGVTQPLHGNLVAGCAVARPDNGKGLAGVAFNCKYLPLKIYPNTAAGRFAGFEAIVYAADHGCQVINLSWGGPGGRSQFEQDVVTYAAVNRNAVVVAAAGNTNAELDFYPASYDHVISVAALAPNDEKSGPATYSTHVALSAPGEAVLTVLGNNDSDYFPVNGSSFAAPLVAGAAALVRTRFPQFTADQVAAQLRQTTDDIYALPGNTGLRDKLGTGRLNVSRAVRLTDRREARVLTTSISPARPVYLPGDTLRLTTQVQNLLQPISGLTLTVTSLSSYLTVRQGTFSIGALATLATTTNAAAPFRLAVAGTVPVNTRAVLRYRFTAAGGYQSDQFLTVVLNPDYVVLDANDLHLTLTSRGNLGFDGLGSDLGQSVTYKNNGALLYEGGLMVATAPTRVSDRVRNDRNVPDQDFYALSQVALLRQPGRATQEAAGVFQDSLPTLTRNRTVGLRIRQHAYAWADAPHRDYVIVEYQLKNITADTLKPLYAGLFMDWDISPDANRNAAAWDSVRALGYAYTPAAPTVYAGVKLLAGGVPACYSINNNAPASAPVYLRNGFSAAEKFLTLSNKARQSSAGLPTATDISQVVGAARVRLAPGDSVVVAFAVLGAATLPALQAAADAAQSRYNAVVLPVRRAQSAAAWQLYPNPTSGSVLVEVPDDFAGREIRVLNTLGQVVLKQKLTNRSTTLELSAQPAGIYLVQVHGAAGVLTRRVLLQR